MHVVICWKVFLSILSKCVAPPTSLLSAAFVDPSDAAGPPAESSMCGQTEFWSQWKELWRFLPNLPTVSVKGIRRLRILSVILLHTQRRGWRILAEFWEKQHKRSDEEQPTNCVFACAWKCASGKRQQGKEKALWLNTWLKCALFCAWKRADEDLSSSQL